MKQQKQLQTWKVWVKVLLGFVVTGGSGSTEAEVTKSGGGGGKSWFNLGGGGSPTDDVIFGAT